MSGVSYLAVAPEIVLSVGAVIVLLVGVFARRSVRLLGWMVGLIYILAALAIVLQWRRVDAEGAGFSFEGTIFLDYSSVGVRAILLVVAVLGTATAWEMLVGLGSRFAEGVTLILIATTGFMLMGASADLVMIFVALEIGSIALYVLAGIVRSSLAGDEAALKYFLLGSFASAIFIYGGALVYTATGSTNLFVIASGLSGVHVVRPALLLIGMGLLVVGLGFKVTAAPFHSWAPDVYQGAPSGVVGFMAAAAKIGGFAALINILTGGFERYAAAWGNGLALMAAVSMVVGTLLAIGQSDVRRMLAYSGVAHAGFIITGMVGGTVTNSGVMFYLATYAVMLVGAFAAVTTVSGPAASGSSFEEYRGLGRSSPMVAAVLATLMIAMSGLPVTTGFIGKFQVFTSAWDGGYGWLVITGLVASVAAFFFYLRLVVLMYFGKDEDSGPRSKPTRAVRSVLVFSAGSSILFGVFPGPLLAVLERTIG
ncbi:MAG: NADH-quinone oxidoreductase subunit N [bacterium]|nr:NADH-quinone oxidoreductase subunit N [bacterium]MYH56160.1 NADH-quinone oxidoreductase subunit N [Acidimicrobiia bacterium]